MLTRSLVARPDLRSVFVALIRAPRVLLDLADDLRVEVQPVHPREGGEVEEDVGQFLTQVRMALAPGGEGFTDLGREKPELQGNVRGIARLKCWQIFRRSRISPNRMSAVAKAVLTLDFSMASRSAVARFVPARDLSADASQRLEVMRKSALSRQDNLDAQGAGATPARRSRRVSP